MRILLIGPDPLYAATVRRKLTHLGHSVEVAALAEIGLGVAFRQPQPDAILLDPQGLEVPQISLIRLLRQGGNQTPLIVLARASSAAERISALKAGADDYLQRPVWAEEVLAKLDRIIIRNQEGLGSKIVTGALELNPLAKKITHNGDDVNLKGKEYDILAFLMIKKGIIVPRTDIFYFLYNENDSIGVNIVDFYINRIRIKLEKSGDEVGIVRTIFKKGYLVPDLPSNYPFGRPSLEGKPLSRIRHFGLIPE